MKVLSLFSGIGGFDLGLERAGMTVVGQAEIDPFASKVLAKHWPEVPNYGDVRNVGLGRFTDYIASEPCSTVPGISYAERRPAHGIDLVCGGFPCQDLSVAGKRAGLSGERSGLWFEFHRILSELRPAVALIENVPGLLSSNSGRDFGIILAGLEQLWPGRWGWAVLDSRHFGVPQRRRRLYVVAGPPRERIAQILSLCEGGDWHPAKGRAAGEDVAYSLTAGVRGTGDGHGNAWNSNYVANPLAAHHGRGDLDFDTYIPSLALSEYARDGKGVAQREGVTTLLAHSLRAEGFDASEDGTGRGTPLVAYALQGAGTTSQGSQGSGVKEGASFTLNITDVHGIAHGSTVRRLTPVECLRLQGFPDDWCDVPGVKDGYIYKAAGNAVSVPVIEYLGRRIMAVLS